MQTKKFKCKKRSQLWKKTSHLKEDLKSKKNKKNSTPKTKRNIEFKIKETSTCKQTPSMEIHHKCKKKIQYWKKTPHLKNKTSNARKDPKPGKRPQIQEKENQLRKKTSNPKIE